jgi:hypothetical protein
MSHRVDPPDLQRDASLEGAWHRGSTEQPSARVDAAILAAAHHALAAGNDRPAAAPARALARQRWSRWAPMAAAAAVAGLAFTLVQILPREPGRTRTLDVREAPAPAAQESTVPTAQETATPAAPEVAPTPVPAQAGSVERKDNASPRTSDRDNASVPQMASPPAASATPQSLALEAIEERSSFEDRGSPGTARSKAADATLNEGGVHVDEWVQRIVALHAAGDVAAAAAELRAFRAAEPGADRQLPESLREWAGSVQ